MYHEIKCNTLEKYNWFFEYEMKNKFFIHNWGNVRHNRTYIIQVIYYKEIMEYNYDLENWSFKNINTKISKFRREIL